MATTVTTVAVEPVWRGIAFQKAAYMAANTAAVFTAMYIAFARDLDRPYWAMFTVFIVSKPMSGAVRSKSVYRICGTLMAAAMSVFLIPPLVQTPVLLCLAVALWIGLCVFLSLFDRTPRNYMFLLSGYTVTIIGLSVVNSPLTVFDTAVARVEEVCLGIICAAIAHSVIFPRNTVTDLKEKAEAAIAAAKMWIGDALLRPAAPADIEAQGRFSTLVTDLYARYSHVAFDASDVPRFRPLMRTLLDRMAILLPRITAIQAAAAALQEAGERSQIVSGLLQRASEWCKSTSPENSYLDLMEEIAATDKNTFTDRVSLLRCTILVQLEQLVEAIYDCRILMAKIVNPTLSLPPSLERDVATSKPRSLYRDPGLALLSGFAATAATLLASFIWIETAWPEGYVAVEFAAICCSLFAVFDDPTRLIWTAVAGIALALPVAAVYEFLIFPQIDGFAMLALVLTPVVLLLSYMQTFEKLEKPALLLAVAFSGALAIQETYRADFATFVNSNVAEMVGPLIALASNAAFRTIDPQWNARRIMRTAWLSLGELAESRRVDSRGWMLRMLDRLGLAAARLQHPSDAADMVGAMRVGLNITASREFRDIPAIDELTRDIAGFYRAKAQGLTEPISLGFEAAIAEGVSAIAILPPSESRAQGLAALAGLQLDFARGATP